MGTTSNNNKWLESLNPEQRQAAEHNYGPLLILAGAGSGKTTVLVSRAGRLIEEQIVSPKRLCVLTFTNKAARELKQRVATRLGSKGNQIWAGTFHSFGLNLLKRFHTEAGLPKFFGILDSKDSQGIIKELLSNFQYADKSGFKIDKLAFMLADWRERNQTQAVKDEEYEAATEWLLPRYLKRLELLGATDFDGLILKPLELMKNPSLKEQIQNDFDQVMVDEFQDTNLTQLQLVRCLSDGHKNIAVVGDDDQSIYGWRGAQIKNILHFPRYYTDCKVVRLERNYRSTPAILNLGNEVISKNSNRHKKVLIAQSTLETGKLPELFVLADEHEEAQTISAEIERFRGEGYDYKDVGVLYRSNSIGAFLELELRRNHIPYSISGGTGFFDRKETRDILAYLRLALKPNDVAFRRVLNTPPRGIGDKTTELLHAKAHGTSFLNTTKNWQEAGVEPRAGKSIDELFSQIDGLVPRLLDATIPSGNALLSFVDTIGYKKYLEKLSGDLSQATRRWKHVELFCDVLNRFVETGGKKRKALSEFLDAMELRDVIEDDKKKDSVQMMTLHACKGLEFPVVLLSGIEEDILPHKTLGGDISEERRLFYVGITRARERLILTRSCQRQRFGKKVDSAASRFLLEIPDHLIDSHVGPRPITDSKRKSMVADLFKKLDALDGISS